MYTLGCNVYLQAAEEQDRLLTECLGSLLRILDEESPPPRLFWTRDDARGPHVVAMMSGPEATAKKRKESLVNALEAHLESLPRAFALPREEVEKRHLQCRGFTISAVDGEEGFAAPGTFRLFEQPEDGYPFAPLRDSVRAAPFWRQVDAASRWSIEKLAHDSAGRNAAALAWIAAIDRAIGEFWQNGAENAAEAYWRYHLGTLRPRLGTHLSEDPDAILDALPRLLGESNQRAFTALWNRVPTPAAATGVVEIVADLEPTERHRILRQIDHDVLKQLGLAVPLHMPPVLYAWSRRADRGTLVGGAA